MSRHPDEATLHDLVDGTLPPELVHTTREHIAGCAACSELVLKLRRVRELLAELPRELEPPPAAWAGVQAAIARSRRPREAVGPRARWFGGRWGQLAAAGIVLVLAGVGVYTLEQRRTPEERAGGVAAAPGRATDPRADAGDAPAARELFQALASRQHVLPPNTMSLVEEQLFVLERAVTDTRQALSADPGNPHLAELLRHVQQQREEYIRSALTIATGI